jgi:hypothetical protein
MSKEPSLFSVAQEIAFGLLVLWIGLCGFEMENMRWTSLPEWSFYLSTALAGALFTLLWVKKRLRIAGILGGVVGGLTALWTTTTVLREVDELNKIMVLFVVIAGLLPGLGVLLTLKLLQDWLWPPNEGGEKGPQN